LYGAQWAIGLYPPIRRGENLGSLSVLNSLFKSSRRICQGLPLLVFFRQLTFQFGGRQNSVENFPSPRQAESAASGGQRNARTSNEH
jgi:hypothetical protein